MGPHRTHEDHELIDDDLGDVAGETIYEDFVAGLLRPEPIEDLEPAAYLRREELVANGFDPDDGEDGVDDDDSEDA
jgi:hypothetical protein